MSLRVLVWICVWHVSLAFLPALQSVSRTTSLSVSANRRILLLSSALRMSADPPIRVALVGAGIFARTAHAPILQQSPLFECVAVWSRRLESAQALADEIGCDAYSGTLDDILARKDVDAVIMALPLDVQPKLLPQVFRAGKHVMSEKPIAPTVAVAKELVQQYDPKKLHWSVGENFRYEPAWLCLQEIVKSEIGKPYLVSLVLRSPFLPDNQYLNTPWRKDPSWGESGLFIDSFVHASAGLRMLVGDAVEVSAQTQSLAEYLPGQDTMVARVQWPQQTLGVVSVTYACQTLKFELEVTGTKQRVILRRGEPGWQVVTIGETERVEEFSFSGIEGEYEAFGRAILDKREDRNTPQEALRDLAFVEACMKSAQQNGKPVQPEL